MLRRRLVVLALVAAAAGCPANRPPAVVAPGQTPTPHDGHDAHAAPDRADDGLGTIDFPVTGSPAARREFEAGVLAMHSFWYEEAKRRFQAAIAAEPSFVMGHWGLAMAHAQILFQNDDLDAGRAILAKLPPQDKLTERERAWIRVANELYAGADAPARRAAFVAALEQMYRAYPDDSEVASLLALGLISTGPPGVPVSMTDRARAGALALEVLAKHPRHPGAAHYAIHAFDTPELARIGLPAARQYAQIAPAAYHARHMPAHIFARLGDWKAAAASCQSAWDVSLAGEFVYHDFHSLSWLVPLAFERGRRSDADAALKQFAAEVRKGAHYGARGIYLEVVGQYLDATEQWTRLDELLEPLSATPVDQPDTPKGPDAPPFAIFEQNRLAGLRAQVAAERKDEAAALRSLQESERFLPKLRPFLEKQMGKRALDEQLAKEKPMMELGRKLTSARARRDNKAAIPLLRKLIEEIDKQPHDEPSVMGGSPREGLVMTLVALDKHADALVELRYLLQRHPNRARLLLMAARAAAKANEPVASFDYYAQLVEVWRDADAGFPGLDEARAAVAKGRPQPATPAPTTPPSPPATPPPPPAHRH